MLPRSLIMGIVVPKNTPPSAGWTSYDGWDYNGMKERLERFMSIINKSSLVEHTQLIIGQLSGYELEQGLRLMNLIDH
jgi:hypothetical protein